MTLSGTLKAGEQTCPCGQRIDDVIGLGLVGKEILERLHIDGRGGEAGAVYQIQQRFTGDFKAAVKAAVASVLFYKIFEHR